MIFTDQTTALTAVGSGEFAIFFPEDARLPLITDRELLKLFLIRFYFLVGSVRALRRWRSSDMPASSTNGSFAASSRRAYQAASGVADKPYATTLNRIVQVAAAISVSAGRLASWNRSRRCHAPRPWHCLNFLPLPQGQGSLRPALAYNSCRRLS